MRKILVTGGAGFIGSHLVDTFVEQGYSVVVVDNLSSGSLKNLNKKSKFIKLDINDPKIGQLIRDIKPDYIFHLAAQTSISKSVENPREDLNTNLMSLVPILDAAADVKLKKFFFASSAAVYGDSGQHPISEDSLKNPTSPYGLAKWSAEFLIHLYSKNHNLPYVIFRYSNIYGPRQDSSAEGGVVAIFINNILNSQAVTIFGDGEQTRDFIYIADVIKANLIFLENEISGSFNVSTKMSTSINSLFSEISKLTGTKAVNRHGPLKHLEVKDSLLSFEKIKKQSSWEPEVSIKEGLKKTISFFKK